MDAVSDTERKAVKLYHYIVQKGGWYTTCYVGDHQIKMGDLLEIEWPNGTTSEHAVIIRRETAWETEQGGGCSRTYEEIDICTTNPEDGKLIFLEVTGLRARFMGNKQILEILRASHE